MNLHVHAKLKENFFEHAKNDEAYKNNRPDVHDLSRRWHETARILAISHQVDRFSQLSMPTLAHIHDMREGSVDADAYPLLPSGRRRALLSLLPGEGREGIPLPAPPSELRLSMGAS